MNLNGKVLYYDNFDRLIFGISSQILKDKPFVAVESIAYGYGVFVKQRKGFFGFGDLKKKHVLDQLIQKVNERLKNKNAAFWFTNEVIFDTIPIQYIQFIQFIMARRPTQIEMIKRVFPDIPIIKYSKNDKNINEKINDF